MTRAYRHICQLTALVLTVAATPNPLQAQDRERYREFKLGTGVASVAMLTGVPASEVKVIHQRPAVIQNLEWRPQRWRSGSIVTQTDPLQQVAFSFYNDQLFRMIVDYDRERTAGMTAADMIAAISETYGPVSTAKAGTRALAPKFEEEYSEVVARWVDAGHSVVLYRSSYLGGFRLLVVAPALAALADRANLEAVRLDAVEAPQREVVRKQKESQDKQQADEKARLTNKAGFRP